MKYLKSLIVVVAGLLLLGLRSTVGRLNFRNTVSGPQAADGEDADSPADLSPSGWKDALRRTKVALKDKQLSTQAAGLAYYTTLTFFPALLGLATVYATFTSPQTLLDFIAGLQGIVPPAIYDVIDQQLSPLASAHKGSLGIAAIVSVLALLWTTSGGLQNLIKATNVAYGVKETRGLVKLRLTSIVLSLVLLLLGTAILVMLLLQGTALDKLGAPHMIATIFPWLRWPILIVLISIMLSVIYRYAPNRQTPGWSWVSWGAAAATIIWLLGTALFFYYAQKFGNFNKSYGIFAGIIVLMTWFNLSSLIVLIGAQVNNKLEEVTDADTTAD
ncbi:MAG TPA: YihY/virulence factor BrkB family protein [Candidatus Saccharimonadales bacterium]|jgi:membrane protein